MTDASDRIFRILPQLNLLLCIEHKGCYTLDNYEHHLVNVHRIKGAAKRTICQWVREHNLSHEFNVPENYCPPIDGLRIVSGYHCSDDVCGYLTTNLNLITQHVSHEHDIRSTEAQRQLNAYKECHIQRLFKNRSCLFAVSTGAGTQSFVPRRQSTPDALERSSASLNPDEQFQAFIEDGLKQAETKATSDRDIHHIGAPPEIGNELLPWLKVTGCEALLKGQDLDAISLAMDIPEKAAPDSTRLDRLLVLLAKVLNVVMQEIYSIVPILPYPTACLLNSLHSDSVSDPFGTIQSDTTFAAYSRCLLQLLCFTARVYREDTSLKDICFLSEVENERMEALLHALSASLDENPNDVFTLVGTCKRPCILMLQALIETTPTMARCQTSPMLAFIACKAHDTKRNLWHRVDQVTSDISKLIYCFQLVILGKSLEQTGTADVATLSQNQVVSSTSYAELNTSLKQSCQDWLVQDSLGSLAVLSSWRLFGLQISADAFDRAQISWNDDKDQIHFRDVAMPLSDIKVELKKTITELERILVEELLLELPDVPEYDVSEFFDNVDDDRVGYSLLDNPRNEILLAGRQRFVVDGAAKNARLKCEIWDGCKVRREFAKRYESASQRFLKELLVALHKGSGQPARTTELLTVIWKNTIKRPRDLTILLSQLSFTIPYDNSRTRMHRSRYPVRFPLKIVQRLLLSYLSLVLPMREYLSATTMIPAIISPFLFSVNSEPWRSDEMSRILIESSRQKLGYSINIHAWQQIYAGIILQYPPKDKRADFDLEDLIPEIDLLMDAAHSQPGHSTATANSSYRKTVKLRLDLISAD